MLPGPEKTARPSPAYARIYRVVKRIPRGRVATYGQIARLASSSGPRQVGYALHALPGDLPVPWHRVINARGEVSLRRHSEAADVQRLRLEAEGVLFDARGRISLFEFQWRK